MDAKRLGPYRIVGTLGHGGMGAVYAAVNEETGERAAVKILSATMSQHLDFRHRFKAEIETLRKLRHRHIVRLFGFGEQDGLLYYSMELVDGSSLEQELQQGRLFTWREVAQIGIETCRALRHAHDRGVIHRDIKPANLLLTKDEHVKLSDFGIARLFGTQGLTAAGNVLGTVEFMAPEQADGRPVGPRTDLYSLGAVFFTLLTGRPPFRGATPFKILEKQRSAKPELVSRYAPGVPNEFELMISELMAKDPEHRVGNATLLQRRLEAMLHALADLPDEAEPGPGRTVLGGFDLPRTAPTPRPLPRDDPSHTKTAKEPGQSSPPPGGPLPASGPPPAGEDLAETKMTSAFQAYAEPHAEAQAGAQAEAPSDGGETEADAQAGADLAEPGGSEAPSSPTTDHFTVVHEDDLDKVEIEEPLERSLMSPQTWALAIGLIVMGLGAWYLLRPPSADSLYRRISKTTEDRKIGSLIAAKPDIKDFLARFSNDPRCEHLRYFEREIELHYLENDFEKKWESSDPKMPIERAYGEALDCARRNPELAIAKLDAIVNLYSGKMNDSGPTGQYLELIQRKRTQLQLQLDAWRADDVAVLGDRLDHADELSRSGSPEKRRQADQIRRAVIELYSDKPWAKEAVERARKALGAGDKSN